MSRRSDAAIRNARHPKLAGNARYVVDGSGLRATHGAHLLRGADGAAAHAHADTVHAGLDQMQRLARGDDVASDNLHGWVRGLDVFDHVELVHGVSLTRVDHDDVHARLHKHSAAVLVIGTGSNRRPHQQLAFGVLGCVGELSALLDV